MLKTLGLLAFSGEFIKGGHNQTQRAEMFAKRAQDAGIPVDAEFVRLCGWTMVACGFAVNVPFLRRPAALIIAALLVPVTYIGHRFWEIEDPQQRDNQLTQVFKNASMFGGALYIAAKG